MNHNFVVIGYNAEKELVAQEEEGPFNQVVDFLYYKPSLKRLKTVMSKAMIALLIPFDLEKHGLEIEDVDGWADTVFLKGKRDTIAFLEALELFQKVLPILMEEEDWMFYEQPFQSFMGKVQALVRKEEVKYLTFYDLYC